MEIRPRFSPPIARRQDPEYLVLVYAGNNVPSLGSNPQPVAGSYRLIPELKQLAPSTQEAPVALVFQGYEQSAGGPWETRRYSVSQGQLQDQTASMKGTQYLYSTEQPPKLLDKAPASGSAVSLWDPPSVRDFLLSAMSEYPHAKHVVLFVNGHGAPGPELAGEAIIRGQWQTVRRESMTVTDFTRTLGEVEKQTGRRLDLVDLNCCEMGKAENTVEFAPHTDFLVGSPQNEFAPKGHEQTAAFQDIVGACKELLARPTMAPREFGETIIEQTVKNTTFVENGKVENPVPTLDLYNCGQGRELAGGLSQLGEELSIALDDPALRRTILAGASQAFHFNDKVIDLRDFLGRLKEVAPAAGTLTRALDGLTLKSFAGHFRETDYSQTGPLGLFLPPIPGPQDDRPVAVAEKGTNISPQVETLVSGQGMLEPRRWAMKQSSLLNDLFSNVHSSYQAMLEVVPDGNVEKALSSLSDPGHLCRIADQLNEMIPTLPRSATEPPPQLVEILHDIQARLAPLQESLHSVDVPAWLTRFDAEEGTAKMRRMAIDRELGKIRKEVFEPVRAYQQMDNLPEGWKKFVDKLAHIITDEIWPEKLNGSVLEPTPEHNRPENPHD